MWRIASHNVPKHVYGGGVGNGNSCQRHRLDLILGKILLTLCLSFQTCLVRGWAGCSLRTPTKAWEPSSIPPFPIPILPILPRHWILSCPSIFCTIFSCTGRLRCLRMTSPPAALPPPGPNHMTSSAIFKEFNRQRSPAAKMPSVATTLSE